MRKYIKKSSKLLAVGGLMLSSITLALAYNPAPFNSSKPSDVDIKKLVDFIISPQFLGANELPTSYYLGEQSDVDKYFGDYVCGLPDSSCYVKDVIYTNPFAILGENALTGTPEQKMGAKLQVERVNMKYGNNIYDAATWQIAVALAAANGYMESTRAKQLVNNQLNELSRQRATTGFQYGYTHEFPVSQADKAFSFRMVPNDPNSKGSGFHKDPLGAYKGYVNAGYRVEEVDPQSKYPPKFLDYVTTWADFKPITGENAWAQLLGPLQAEYLLNKAEIMNSQAMRNAINNLDAFSYMQAGIGAFYYAPGGSMGNQGGPVAKGEISMENNFSVLAGLQVMKRILDEVEQTSDVQAAKEKVNIMLNGGRTVNGFETIGLLKFMRNGAFNKEKGFFYTSGLAEDPRSTTDWKPNKSTSGMAVDVNTWGILALGANNIDNWFGKDTALNMWKKVKEHGGYYKDGQLWGVGYTFNNQSPAEQIMSTEWTAGAIAAVDALFIHYPTTPYAEQVHPDLVSMKAGIVNLRNDKYLAAGFNDAAPSSAYGAHVVVPPAVGQAYLYSSKRMLIPFGWYGNPIPSVTSNAWVIMNRFRYNPFQFGGKLSGEDYSSVPGDVKLTPDTCGTDTLEQDAVVTFDAGDATNGGLGPITRLSLSYSSVASPTMSADWVSATGSPVQGRTGTATLPAGTKMISISYENAGNWAGVCRLPVESLFIKPVCTNMYTTIVVKYSADGMGECSVR